MNTLFSNVTAVLMDEGHRVLPQAYVQVEDGKIVYVGQERPRGFSGTQLNGGGRVLMPGFVNAHTHLPMTVMRGYGGGHDLQTWLNEFIFPVEDKWDDRAIRAATQLGVAEMIASGVTCVADMYMRCETIIEELVAAGLNANVCCGVTQFTPDFDPDTQSDCVLHRAMTEHWHGYNGGQIRIDASIHGEYTSYLAPAAWEWAARYAADHKQGMHVHLSETKKEQEECVARHGKTPAAVFADHGVFDVRAIAAHCVWTTRSDWEILRRHGVSAVHNPTSNLKLGSGVAPIPAMRRAGVNVALGTDGMSSNNASDLFFDMKLAAILHNGVEHDPLAMTAWEALEMATVNGGRALGRKTGRIAPGYDADLILVDFDRPHLTPCHDVAENLVFAARGSDVVMNMCRGKVIYKDGEFLTIDLERMKRELADYAMPRLFHGQEG